MRMRHEQVKSWTTFETQLDTAVDNGGQLVRDGDQIDRKTGDKSCQKGALEGFTFQRRPCRGRC